MTQQLFPVALFERGYRDLIAVIPPNATLSPGSKIAANQLGKVPGCKLSNGTWAGYAWRTHEATVDDVRRWALDGANIGLRAARFPGLDIDSLDERIAEQVQQIALTVLGSAPVRVGRAPKRLLMYRTEAPFTRMRLWVESEGGESHLIELLGDGQQYLVHGTHPATKRAYEWSEDLTVREGSSLTAIMVEQVEACFARITEVFEAQGYRTHREGTGRRQDRTTTADQATLHTPSPEALREAVAHIPNSNERFSTREDYIRMGYAIRAATGDDIEAGFDVFAEWASRWDGGTNEAETVLADWRRMRPPYSVGWPWLAEVARQYGYNDAAHDFDTQGAAPAPPPRQRVKLSDRWLADEVVSRIGDRLRYVPGTGRWLVWDGQRWVHDELMRARTEVGEILHDIACELIAAATTDKALVTAGREARHIESTHTLLQVLKLVQADRSIALAPSALDADPWLLNTPSGAVDLRSGKLLLARPDQLATKLTRMGPDFGGPCPEWKRFLAEATGGDREMEAYLQRLAGYCLTGSTREEVFAFIWGPGGNGKSKFLGAVREVMGDYAKVAAMDTFMASNFDRHSTDLADLMGARLVSASETQGGRRWDEQRVKALTGGDPIKARFMRQDNFMYLPAFKLLFVGNNKPAVRDLDAAIRRRIHMVPFTVTPARIDLELADKLRVEYPAILSWMIEGCLAWQQGGLNPPASVRTATEEYFEEEDAVGRWIAECCELVPSVNMESARLYESWKEWANANGEFVGSQKRLSQALVQRHFERWRHPESRRMGFVGLQAKVGATWP